MRNKIPGHSLRQFHRFRIQFINLGVYRTHGFLEIEFFVHFFRRHTYIATRGEVPVILFDFIDADQPDEPLNIAQFRLREALLKPVSL